MQLMLPPHQTAIEVPKKRDPPYDTYCHVLIQNDAPYLNVQVHY